MIEQPRVCVKLCYQDQDLEGEIGLAGSWDDFRPLKEVVKGLQVPEDLDGGEASPTRRVEERLTKKSGSGGGGARPSRVGDGQRAGEVEVPVGEGLTCQQLHEDTIEKAKERNGAEAPKFWGNEMNVNEIGLEGEREGGHHFDKEVGEGRQDRIVSEGDETE